MIFGKWHVSPRTRLEYNNWDIWKVQLLQAKNPVGVKEKRPSTTATPKKERNFKVQIQILKLTYQTEQFVIELFWQEVLSNKSLDGIWVSAYRGNVVQNIFPLVPKIHDTGTTLQILLLIFSIF